MPNYNIDVSEEFRGMGKAIGEAFKARYDRKRFEDFRNGPLKTFQDKSTKLMEQMEADPDNPDLTAMAMRGWHEMGSEFLSAASSPDYADNPYVAQAAKNMFDFNMKQVDDIFLEGPKRQQEAELTEARVGQAKAGAEASQAQAELSREKATTERMTRGMKPGTVKPTSFTEGATTPAEARRLLNRPEKVFADLRDQEKTVVTRELAQRELNRAIAAKEPNPSTGALYGPGDLEAIASTRISPTLVHRTWESQRLQLEGHDLAAYGDYYGNALEKQEAAMEPIRGRISDYRIGGFLLGPESIEGLAATKNTTPDQLTVDTIISSLPENVGQLPTGMLKGIFGAVGAENGINPFTDAAYTSTEELIATMTAYGEGQIQSFSVGPGVADKDLDPQSKASRRQARKLVHAAIVKYGPQIARTLELPGAPSRERGFFEGRSKLLIQQAGPIVKSAAAAVLGLLTPEPEITPGLVAPRKKK